MLVKCSLCGGENEIHPGQKVLFCSYCGSTLALEDNGGPEHLILPHKRNDRNAEETLRSFLLNKSRARPRDVKVNFQYVPFLMIEDDKGRVRTMPALNKSAVPDDLPYPPAGSYRFFDETLADEEKVLPVEKSENGTIKILPLPLYQVSYSAGSAEYEAAVIGESWQVLAGELPPESPVTLNMNNVLAAAGLFVVYLFIGKAAPSWPGRLAILLAASTVGITIYYLHGKLVRHR